ncbi:hypothetical protein [Larkinella sp.]|uniref:hypothetical protein n=1 Tax=Larkinella sp. TaxID=2034517 RepID=UPI003BA9257E
MTTAGKSTRKTLLKMAYFVMKVTVSNIERLWFAANTPLQQLKIKANPEIWKACQEVAVRFTPPSGRSTVERYRKSDRVAFAKAVQEVYWSKNRNQTDHS